LAGDTWVGLVKADAACGRKSAKKELAIKKVGVKRRIKLIVRVVPMRDSFFVLLCSCALVLLCSCALVLLCSCAHPVPLDLTVVTRGAD
jgi:hypothetical protein